MIVELQKVNQRIWNTALTKSGNNGTIFQSTYWAEFLKKSFGDHPIYLASLDKKGDIQGLLLAIESCYSRHPSLTLSGNRGLILGELYKRAISPLFSKMLPFIYWENGPVLLSDFMTNSSHNETLYREFLKKTVETAQKHNCYEIKFARPGFCNDHKEIFSSLEFQRHRMGTILVDLEYPEEILWKRVEKDTRRVVRRAFEKGIEIIKVSTIGELEDFYVLNVQLSKRAGQKIYPFSYFESLWRHFSSNGKLVVFNAYIKDKPVGGALCLIYNKIIHLFALGDSDYSRKNRINSLYALLWHIIKWGHEGRMKHFDLSGVEFYKIESGDKKAWNIFRFKSKWGGQIIEYHDYWKTLRTKKLAKFLNRFMTDSIVHN